MRGSGKEEERAVAADKRMRQQQRRGTEEEAAAAAKQRGERPAAKAVQRWRRQEAERRGKECVSNPLIT